MWRTMSVRPWVSVVISVAACVSGARASTQGDAPPRLPNNAAVAVAEQYCRLALDGAALTAAGRKQFAELGVSIEAPPPRKVAVVRLLEVTAHRMVNDQQASVRLDSTYVGSLDTASARLEREAPGLHGVDELTVRLKNGRWRIDGASMAPYVGIQAAIKHVSALRDKTTDRRVRANTDRTLAVLKRNLPRTRP
jgi:hypothetical protein